MFISAKASDALDSAFWRVPFTGSTHVDDVVSAALIHFATVDDDDFVAAFGKSTSRGRWGIEVARSLALDDAADAIRRLDAADGPAKKMRDRAAEAVERLR